MTKLELTKKQKESRQILKDIGFAHCLICKDIKSLDKMAKQSGHCLKCDDVIHSPIFKAANTRQSDKPTMVLHHNMETKKYTLSVVEWEDMTGYGDYEEVKVTLYSGFIDDLWCYLGSAMLSIGVDINAE